MDFRQYDNAIGRFNVMDALSEQDFGNSPYAFAGNNPVLYGDPSGLKMVYGLAAPGNHKSLAEITDEIVNSHDEEGGGGGGAFGEGGNNTQFLQQQMWGPNFGISSDGFVNINGGSAMGLDGAKSSRVLSSDAFGSWVRYYMGNEDPKNTNYTIFKTDDGFSLLPDCDIKPIYIYQFELESDNWIRKVGNGFSNFGTGVEVGSIIGAFPSEGVTLLGLPIGAASSGIGTVINAARDYYVGDKYSAVSRLIIFGATYGLGNQIEALKESNAINAIDEKILQTLNFFYGQGLERSGEK